MWRVRASRRWSLRIIRAAERRGRLVYRKGIHLLTRRGRLDVRTWGARGSTSSTPCAPAFHFALILALAREPVGSPGV